jgi:hypothetical protein
MMEQLVSLKYEYDPANALMKFMIRSTKAEFPLVEQYLPFDADRLGAQELSALFRSMAYRIDVIFPPHAKCECCAGKGWLAA